MLIKVNKSLGKTLIMDNITFLTTYLLYEITISDNTKDDLIKKYDDFLETQTNYDLYKDSKFHKNSNLIINTVYSIQTIIKDLEKRKQFYECYVNDINFYNQSSYEDYKFLTIDFEFSSDEQENDKIKEEIKKLFQLFYTKFIYEKEKDQVFNNRSILIDEYKNENGGKLICPSCLSSLNLKNAKLDHYFPKHIFNVLSLHPYNLVPICEECNTRAGSKTNMGKGEKIPNTSHLNSDYNYAGSLKDIFLPYINSAEGNIYAKIEWKTTQKSYYDLRFQPSYIDYTNISQIQKNMLLKHEKLFNLEEKWSSTIETINGILCEEIERYFVIRGLTLNIYEVKEYLYTNYICYSNNIENISKYADYVLRYSYAKFLYEDDFNLKAFYANLQIKIS